MKAENHKKSLDGCFSSLLETRCVFFLSFCDPFRFPIHCWELWCFCPIHAFERDFLWMIQKLVGFSSLCPFLFRHLSWFLVYEQCFMLLLPFSCFTWQKKNHRLHWCVRSKRERERDYREVVFEIFGGIPRFFSSTSSSLLMIAQRRSSLKGWTFINKDFRWTLKPHQKCLTSLCNVFERTKHLSIWLKSSLTRRKG